MHVKEFKLLMVIKNSSSDETDYFTGHTLLNNSRKSDKKYEKIWFSFKGLCILWREKSYIDSLQYSYQRRNSAKYFEESGRLFLHLLKSHLKKHFKVQYSCVKCGRKDHNVSICDKVNEKNHVAKESLDGNSHIL